MTKYIVEFERIGRKKNVPTLSTKAIDADDLAEKIWRYARPHLMSRDIEVFVDENIGGGHILCGMRNGGKFSITEIM